MTLAILFSLKSMERLENGLQPHSMQSCRSVDALTLSAPNGVSNDCLVSAPNGVSNDCLVYQRFYLASSQHCTAFMLTLSVKTLNEKDALT